MGFLDKDGLTTLWAKIKANFAAKEHSHSGYATTSALTSLETNVSNALNGKANSTHTHSSYVNQNAFSNVKVGDTTIAADTTTDTLTLVAGSNVTITPDATNDKITIAATNTTYSLVGTNGTSGLIKNGSSVTSSSGYTACPIISGVPYYKDTNSTYSLSSFGITATAAELNFMDGVTSNVQTQLNGKASSTHSHSEYLTEHQSLANYMKLTDAQTVKGAKTFSDGITIGSAGGLTIEGVLQIKNGITALMSATSSTYSKGKSGQVLTSNGSGVYWSNPSSGGGSVTYEHYICLSGLGNYKLYFTLYTSSSTPFTASALNTYISNRYYQGCGYYMSPDGPQLPPIGFYIVNNRITYSVNNTAPVGGVSFTLVSDTVKAI